MNLFVARWMHADALLSPHIFFSSICSDATCPRRCTGIQLYVSAFIYAYTRMGMCVAAFVCTRYTYTDSLRTCVFLCLEPRGALAAKCVAVLAGHEVDDSDRAREVAVSGPTPRWWNLRALCWDKTKRYTVFLVQIWAIAKL